MGSMSMFTLPLDRRNQDMQTPLHEGVVRTQIRNPFGGVTGSEYYYNGARYESADAANAAARDAMSRASGKMGQVDTGIYGYQTPGGGVTGGGIRTSGSGGGGTGYSGGNLATGTSGDLVNSTGYGGGNVNLSRPAYEEQQAMALKKKYADEMFAKITGQMGSGSNPAQVEYGNGAAGEAARAAAFARAKEQAGQNAQAAMKSMSDIMSRKGLSGSSIEAGAQGDIISSGGSDIANVITNQMQDELANIQHVNDVTYQGNITQRGQDQAARNAYLSLLTNLY